MTKSGKNILKLRDGIVHVHNFKDALKLAVAKKLTHSNIKIVVTRHLVRPAKTSRLYTWVYANVEKIIFVSDLARKAFLSSQPKVDEAKLCVVRNSIKTNANANSFAVDDIKASLPNDTTILMYHGRIANKEPKVREAMERQVKAIIQSYMERMTQNELVVK